MKGCIGQKRPNGRRQHAHPPDLFAPGSKIREHVGERPGGDKRQDRDYPPSCRLGGTNGGDEGREHHHHDEGSQVDVGERVTIAVVTTGSARVRGAYGGADRIRTDE